jgi:hypothetical protein
LKTNPGWNLPNMSNRNMRTLEFTGHVDSVRENQTGGRVPTLHHWSRTFLLMHYDVPDAPRMLQLPLGMTGKAIQLRPWATCSSWVGPPPTSLQRGWGQAPDESGRVFLTNGAESNAKDPGPKIPESSLSTDSWLVACFDKEW